MSALLRGSESPDQCPEVGPRVTPQLCVGELRLKVVGPCSPNRAQTPGLSGGAQPGAAARSPPARRKMGRVCRVSPQLPGR